MLEEIKKLREKHTTERVRCSLKVWLGKVKTEKIRNLVVNISMTSGEEQAPMERGEIRNGWAKIVAVSE